MGGIFISRSNYTSICRAFTMPQHVVGLHVADGNRPWKFSTCLAQPAKLRGECWRDWFKLSTACLSVLVISCVSTHTDEALQQGCCWLVVTSSRSVVADGLSRVLPGCVLGLTTTSRAKAECWSGRERERAVLPWAYEFHFQTFSS